MWSEWRSAAIALGAGIGVVITLPALFLALLSAGAGEGDYGFARGLFPIPMCVAVFITGSIELPTLVLACVQFPVYGAAIGYCAGVSNKAFIMAVSSIAFVHLLGFVACSSSSAFS
jgi:hypothetical protein